MKQTSAVHKEKSSKFIATPIYIGEQKKKKHNNEYTLKSKDKQENQDIDWLENIVKQFQKYHDEPTNDKPQPPKEEIAVPQPSRPKKTGFGSCQRGLPVNEFNKKNTHNKSREVRHEVLIKNFSANRNLGSQSSKKRYQPQSSTQNLKTRVPFTPKPNSSSQQKGNRKHQIAPSTSEIIKNMQITVMSNTAQSLKNLQPQSFSQTEKQKQEEEKLSSTSRILTVGKADLNLIKMNNKYSLPEAKRLANKMAVKEDRKYFVQETGKISIGKIVKNKSVQMKEKRYEEDKQNIGLCKQQHRNHKIKDSKQVQPKLTNQKSSNNEIENFLSSRSKANKAAEDNSINKVTKQIEKNIKKSQQEILSTIKEVLKERKVEHAERIDTKTNELKREELETKQKQKEQQKEKEKVKKNRITFSLADLSREKRIEREKEQIRQNIKQKQNYSSSVEKPHHANFSKKETEREMSCIRNQKQTENKKFHYLVENLQNRLERLNQKKQRKLNCSFGDRKILHYDYGTEDNAQLYSKKRFNYESSPKIVFTSPPQEIEKGSVLNLSQFSTMTHHQQNEKKQEMKSEAKVQKSTTKISTETPAYEGFPNLSIGNKVKLVESAHNSQVFTQHSLVIEKSQALNNIEVKEVKFTVDNGIGTQSSAKEQDKGDWNIMHIFEKLDRKKNGILDADNCSIEYVSRQIRYILGAVLEEILYKDIKYDFATFIARVEQTLEKIKDPQISPAYMKLKQLVPTTRRSIEASNLDSNSRSASIYQMTGGQTDKKYKYSQVFMEGPQTEPTYSTGNKNNLVSNSNNKSNKAIRFATFQDEDLDQKDKQFVLPESDPLFGGLAQSRETMLGSSVWAILTKEEQLQKKLQRKLSKLNEFKSKIPINVNNHLSSLPAPTQLSAPCQPHQFDYIPSLSLVARDASESNFYSTHRTQDHSNEMIKLEELNKRLEKYLYDQNMKEFCASKLIIDG